MDVILLDTNIVSFILKGDSRTSDYELHLKEQHLAISFMTVAELYQWAAVRKWGERRRAQLTQTLQANYTVLSFDVRLCRIWGDIRAERQLTGKPISPQDAWVAATALHYRLPLVTHNPKDFADIANLRIITTVE
ncbi:MAG: type II toxin-antitoxin system VapC family toxin [Caldilineaceae bacterium]|nr:type II toxin-antitoxin system VapC family toxin [Caldilineaceae bacterium]MCB9150617.1 type II toxin-antitoxin system VapC family toxin [Caldilineaceae bacterium]MCB9156347.1 type II toxin-antitoxin system VapC family toxin [Caldilineaceae bacterium]